MKRLVLIAVVLGAATFGVVAPAEEGTPRRVVFSGGNDIAELWANISLTGLRLDEDYLPMVVAVVNRSKKTAVIDRDSIRLIGPDGVRYPMPTLKELRKGYSRLSLDYRAVSGAGIPYEVWQRERHLMEANFFPNIMSLRGATVIEEVSLPTNYALIDLLYFAKPRGLTSGKPFLLEVVAIGWEAPVRLGIVLN